MGRGSLSATCDADDVYSWRAYSTMSVYRSNGPVCSKMFGLVCIFSERYARLLLSAISLAVKKAQKYLYGYRDHVTVAAVCRTAR